MRRRSFAGAAAAFVIIVQGNAAAWAQFATQGGTFGHHHHHGGSLFFSGGQPWFGPTYFGPSWYYGPPPLFVPPSAWYSPRAAGQVSGWNPAPLAAPMNGLPAAPRVVKAPAPQKAIQPGGGFGELAEGEDDKSERPKIRISNAESVARARQFITFGDEHFRTQEFSDAYQRYKKAAAAAPDLADAHFRQGFSLLAMRRYAPAVKALKHGLALRPEWAKSPFRVDDLYGDNQLAKTTHLEQLATEATEHPRNPDLMFLLGLSLYFDGQSERARLFFQRAQELGADRATIAGFLNTAPAAEVGNSVRGREL